MVVPIKLNVKNTISICIQCVFNVYSMCIQDHIKLRDNSRKLLGPIVYSMCIQCVFNVYSMCIQCVFKYILSYMAANNCPISMDYNGSAN